MADGEELDEGRAAGEERVEEDVEGADGAGRREGRVREGAACGGREARAAVGGDNAAEELLARAYVWSGLEEAREDRLHGREEARGSELGDDDVVAARGVAERRRRRGVGRRREEEAKRGGRVRLAAEGGGEVVRRKLRHCGPLHPFRQVGPTSIGADKWGPPNPLA